MNRNEEDLLLRDLIFSSSCQFTEEQMKEIEKEAPWIRLNDDGIEFSQGMAELLLNIEKLQNMYMPDNKDFNMDVKEEK